MPELPDLVHIEKVLRASLPGDTVVAVSVREPVVLRVAVPGGFSEALTGRKVGGCAAMDRSWSWSSLRTS